MSTSNLTPKGESSHASIDTRQADAEYKGFPTFALWEKCTVDSARWDHYGDLLQGRSEVSPGDLRRALGIVRRAAAVDTGAIESLYDVDRAFTLSVATQAALWEAAVDQRGPKVRAMIDSQLQAYDHVLDFATQKVPIGEAWIRSLHEVICRGQETYKAYTEFGPQNQPLLKGQYKSLPNHVIGADGNLHSYAPVDLTPTEMHRFCNELSRSEFLAAHPVIQASFAHYAFVAIHPFPDGNGRVARALASVFTYRSHSVPLLVLADDRQDYYSSLESADRGNYQRFVDFVLERSLDAIRLATDSLRAATFPSPSEGFSSLQRLYKTKGGYTHSEVDEAGENLFKLLRSEFQAQLQGYLAGGVMTATVPFANPDYTASNAQYRLLVSRPAQVLRIMLDSVPPANAHIDRSFGLEVPRDCGKDDDIVIRNTKTNQQFEARMTELVPVPTGALQMRIKIFAEGVVGEAIAALSREAEKSIRKKGY